ncbi:MAG: carbohydrate-binding family 6 protein [Prosthecobacter sp.]|uniref:carbohydrate-binding family 6 protein n=1 Tax=Prosthecobacter sp. TaxID=1965333 RepID=UPI0039032514
MKHVLTLLTVLVALTSPTGAASFSLTNDHSTGGPGKFAEAEIRREAATKPTAAQITLTVEKEAKAAAQSYRIVRVGANIRVIGADESGAMYGGLDIAEAIRMGTLDSVKDSDHKPHIERRGIKFNIPLDLRTPSYSDNSTSAQANITEMWSLEFWHEFIDRMAQDRYNVLTLWNLHPFPSIVKVPEYPKIALDDVWRTTADLVKPFESFSPRGTGMVKPWMLESHEVEKRITIDEKIAFWRAVMDHAHDRGIEVYWFTWNVFTNGTGDQYGITDDLDNATTRDYFRKSVRETVLTYPRLAGIGITSGENMEHKDGSKGKEEWLWATYGEGINDALKIQPERKFRLIHRLHETGLSPILKQWKDYPGPFEFSYKYAVAHMYASRSPSFIKDLLPEITPEHRTWLTVRNDDLYSFRWGDPDFARAFITNMPGPEKLAGFYMGPDGYIWGRDFLSRDAVAADGRRQLVWDRQWFSFNLWGRLSYDPSLPDSHFQRLLGTRHPSVSAEKLFAASQSSSRIIPQVTRFNWGGIDLHWYPEANLSHPKQYKGYYTVRHFMAGKTMPGEDVFSISEWRKALSAKKAITAQTPPEVATALERDADTTLKLLTELRPQAAVTDKELALTLGDYEAQALLGRYYAAKIRSAIDLAEFNASADAATQTSALKHAKNALAHWKQYAAIYDRQYTPQLLNRVGTADIPALTTKAAEDIEIIRTWKPGTEPQQKRK